MNGLKKKLIVICGPTASGKSDVAIRLAKAIDGEIISADSRQIYKGLNLGSGKVLKDKFSPISNFQFPISKQNEIYFSEGIAHHLIDVADPMEDFNISHYKKLGEKAIEDILSRKKIPIICGGAGFWIDALINDTPIPKVAPHEELRSMLRNKSAEELFEELRKLDPARAGNIDTKNPVRLVRAIEIAKTLGSVPKIQPREYGNKNSKYDLLQIGIGVEREILNEKIKKRLEDRFENGMIEEVKDLIEKGVATEWLEKIGLEYRWISRYLQGKIELGEMSAKGGCASGAKEKLYFDIIHYAKRQMTWFKKNKRIIWLKDYESIKREVKNFL